MSNFLNKQQQFKQLIIEFIIWYQAHGAVDKEPTFKEFYKFVFYNKNNTKCELVRVYMNEQLYNQLFNKAIAFLED